MRRAVQKSQPSKEVYARRRLIAGFACLGALLAVDHSLGALARAVSSRPAPAQQPIADIQPSSAPSGSASSGAANDSSAGVSAGAPAQSGSTQSGNSAGQSSAEQNAAGRSLSTNSFHQGSVGSRIVAIATAQVGYRTNPSDTYCNKFSAYWFSGISDCGNSNRDAEWCADFAAWAWRQAGVHFTYRLANGYINSSAVSFYEWGRDHGLWHPLSSGYKPKPGDVAVYGLDVATMYAQHVAVVTGFTPGNKGPNVVSGDGNLTGFSVVEAVSDKYIADSGSAPASLSGYVSPG